MPITSESGSPCGCKAVVLKYIYLKERKNLNEKNVNVTPLLIPIIIICNCFLLMSLEASEH